VSNLVNILEKAMIDKGIKGYKQLSEVSGVGYEIVLNLMKGGTNIKLSKLTLITKALNVEIKYISGES